MDLYYVCKKEASDDKTNDVPFFVLPVTELG